MKNTRLEYILENYPLARENEKELVIAYLQEFTCEADLEKELIAKLIHKAPWLSWITRQRAFYQNELGMYLPSEEIVNKRKLAQERIKERIRKNKWESLFVSLGRFFNKITK